MQKTALTELTAVSAVATHKSFRAAAAALDMSPSALSHAVATLEKRIGVRLFNRTTRSVSLSPAGEQFLARVAPALREISDAMDAVNDHRDTPSGMLRLNTSEIGGRLIQPIILAFLERYPEMNVELVAQGRFVDIVAEGFDAGIRLAESVPQDMIAVKMTEDLSFAVVGAPGYFDGRDKPRVPPICCIIAAFAPVCPAANCSIGNSSAMARFRSSTSLASSRSTTIRSRWRRRWPVLG
jgi:DNA-binding transcriptional LysR family regulator